MAKKPMPFPPKGKPLSKGQMMKADKKEDSAAMAKGKPMPFAKGGKVKKPC
jgi:hypothetical protein